MTIVTDAGGTRIEVELAGYRIDEVIGHGGMATVYRAEQLQLGRDVALKIMAPDLAGDPRFRERFLRESRMAARLEHPNVVPIFDAGESHGLLYIAMRYVPGSDLRSLLDRSGPLPAANAVAVVGQVADALEAAHTLGLLHRDVKPGNILVGETLDASVALSVYLSDFGLSRSASDTSAGDAVLGSVNYISPERIRGDPEDPRSDVYSLGCVLYECLVAEVPFPRDSAAATLYAQLEAPRPQPSARDGRIAPALDAVIAAALSPHPDSRPPGPRALADAAARALAESSSAAPSAPPAVSTPARERPPVGMQILDRPARRLVGRVGEEAELAAALARAIDGHGGLILLAGEAGIGKTALAQRLCEQAERRGVEALWSSGGAFGEAPPPYWHWVQVLRGLARRPDSAELFGQLNDAAAWLAAIAPDLAPELGLRSQPSASAAGEGRFHAFDTLGRLLTRASSRSGLLVVLDDLHLADEASLLALGFIASVIRASGVLVVGTYRDDEPTGRTGVGASPLADLLGSSDRLVLTGLDTDQVERIVTARAGGQDSATLARRVHEVSAGNPLFVAEILNLPRVRRRA